MFVYVWRGETPAPQLDALLGPVELTTTAAVPLPLPDSTLALWAVRPWPWPWPLSTTRLVLERCCKMQYR